MRERGEFDGKKFSRRPARRETETFLKQKFPQKIRFSKDEFFKCGAIHHMLKKLSRFFDAFFDCFHLSG